MDETVSVHLIGRIQNGQGVPRSFRLGARVRLTTSNNILLAEGDTDIHGTVQLELAWPYSIEFVAYVYIDEQLSAGIWRNRDFFVLDMKTTQ